MRDTEIPAHVFETTARIGAIHQSICNSQLLPESVVQVRVCHSACSQIRRRDAEAAPRLRAAGHGTSIASAPGSARKVAGSSPAGSPSAVAGTAAVRVMVRAR